MIPLILLAAPTPVAAALAPDPLRLETRILAERRAVAADGTTRVDLVPPTRTGPGDPVVVEVRYRNGGTQPIGGLIVANPVPRGLAYRGPRGALMPELSVDGRTFGALTDLRVAAVDGSTRSATLSDVSYVRWRLSTPVKPGSGGELAFQASVR